MTGRQIIIILLLIWTTCLFGQGFKNGENLYNKPHHKEAADKALTKMQNCMKIWYFKDKKVYDNTLAPILDDDGKGYADFIQIKLSENNIMVLYISKLKQIVDKKEYASNLVAVTSYFVKYGEIDKSTIKYCWLEKKRIYPENNEFTEEIWLTNGMYLVMTDRQYLQTLVIKGIKEIDLINMGANFCN